MASKKERLAEAVAKAVGAGREVALDTVDFGDPNRPKTCLEIDFPILPVNQVAVIEGNAGKPIYQMSKWWARRRSSVFRSMLIAAAARAPEDLAHAARHVWDNYYANHQAKGAFKHLKVADIFMGGGTTLVEGSRLGMQMTGNDLNPVAWFVVKQELANVDPDQVRQLLDDIEAEVKPQIMPYYYCDGPDGEKGKWTHLPSQQIMPPDFDPLGIPRDQRKEYAYSGPESIYTFWAKHGPCQMSGCGHRTPIMGSPVMAVKTLNVKYWEHTCTHCHQHFLVEKDEARMAPDVPLFVSPSESPYSVLDTHQHICCPHCEGTVPARLDARSGLIIDGKQGQIKLGKGKNKKVILSLLVHPQWLKGAARTDASGRPYGGSAQDTPDATGRWDQVRASQIRLLEVRGDMPDIVTCPATGLSFSTKNGTVPRKSHYTCAACGTTQDVLKSVKATGKTGPMAAYAVQGYAPTRHEDGKPYNGRFFAPWNADHARQYDAALAEWEERKEGDLKDYWPRSAILFGFMTGIANGDIREGHGFTHWWTMFNPRQLLVHAQLLKAILTIGDHTWETREYVLGAFQQYLRNHCLFCFWNPQRDTPEPMFSNNNYHPKSTVIEGCVFPFLGRGNWASCTEGIIQGREWAEVPWDVISNDSLTRTHPTLAGKLTGKSEKVYPNDRVQPAMPLQGSSTDLPQIETASLDLVITDPPFGGLLHYSELSDFFYVWLRLALKDKYPDYFSADYTPKTLEAVANRAREPEDPDGFYQRLLTQCWREAHRMLKPGGILAFTFHHSEDKPWVAVLESLFEAGFYLEATYPIRSDETKGDGEFGSKTIEYDIIHVCRKRIEEPSAVSWAKMRREVMADVRQLKDMLENHARDGLPAADLQVIRRGKALEYFSRHYGKVYLTDGKTMSVHDALVGINQLIDEDRAGTQELPPPDAEPMTRQFLRTFGTSSQIERDQMQKLLRGTGTTPDDFEERGWCTEARKVFTRSAALDVARDWQKKHRRKLTTDLDQALVLMGACVANSGINAQDTLKNPNFTPHKALKPLLDWFRRQGPDQETRQAASIALKIFSRWFEEQKERGEALPRQSSLFDDAKGHES